HVATNHVISVAGQTGELVPLYCTAHGKALLADLEKRDLRTIFGSGQLRTYTKETCSSLEDLVRICARIKNDCYATDDGEFQEGIRCVAAPIRTAGNVIIGSIGISAPQLRFPMERYPVCAEQVVEVARQITQRLLTHAEES